MSLPQAMSLDPFSLVFLSPLVRGRTPSDRALRASAIPKFLKAAIIKALSALWDFIRSHAPAAASGPDSETYANILPPTSGSRLDCQSLDLEPPSLQVVRAAIDLLLLGVGVSNGTHIPNPAPEEIGQMSVDAARLHLQAMKVLANDCLQHEILSRKAAVGKHVNALASIARLPDELMLKTFTLVILDYDLPYFGNVCIGRRYALSNVSWKWYLLIRGYAPFWTTILCLDPTYPLSIHLSQNAHLNFSYEARMARNPRLFFRHLEAARSRWYTARIDLTHFGDGESDDSGSDSAVGPISDDDICLKLFGDELKSIDIASCTRPAGCYYAPLQLGNCPSLKELITRGISIRIPPGLGEPLPSLTRLHLRSFAQTATQWRTALSLIAASPGLVDLHISPRYVESPSSQPVLAEVDEKDVQYLAMPELCKLCISWMPPKTLQLFLQRTTLDPGLLDTLELEICCPINETLSTLSDPSACSISQAIRTLSASESEVTVRVMFGLSHDTFGIESGPRYTTGLHITVIGREAISQIVRLPSMVNYLGGPRLHLHLGAFHPVRHIPDVIEDLLQATLHTITCTIICDTPATAVITLLKGQESSARWLWPQLTTLTMTDSQVIKAHKSDLREAVVQRAQGNKDYNCPAKLAVHDLDRSVINEDGEDVPMSEASSDGEEDYTHEELHSEGEDFSPFDGE